MPRPTSIPSTLHGEIRALHAQGVSQRGILAELASKHGVRVSQTSLRRLLVAEAKRDAEASAGRAAKATPATKGKASTTTAPSSPSTEPSPIGSLQVDDNLLTEIDDELRTLKGRLRHTSERGTTNEHVRSLGAFFDLLERRQKIKREEAGPVSHFRDLPELLTTASRNDLRLRQRDAAAWLGVHLPTIVSMLDDAADALERVEDLRKPFGGDLLIHCARVRAALDRHEQASQPTVVAAAE